MPKWYQSEKKNPGMAATDHLTMSEKFIRLHWQCDGVKSISFLSCAYLKNIKWNEVFFNGAKFWHNRLDSIGCLQTIFFAWRHIIKRTFHSVGLLILLSSFSVSFFYFSDPFRKTHLERILRFSFHFSWIFCFEFLPP